MVYQNARQCQGGGRADPAGLVSAARRPARDGKRKAGRRRGGERLLTLEWDHLTWNNAAHRPALIGRAILACAGTSFTGKPVSIPAFAGTCFPDRARRR